MKKHIEVEHFELLCAYVDETIVDNISRSQIASDEDYMVIQPIKKWSKITFGAIFGFFRSKNPYKKQDEIQKLFLEDLVFLMAKGFSPLSICENVWTRWLVLRLEPKVVNFFLKRCWLKRSF
jgi:hypothetical protein